MGVPDGRIGSETAHAHQPTANEKSPYLLQHAHNPVDWYRVGAEAFEKARAEDKPIFLSIGYSTCHWCHVMERESFENEEVAEVLNRYFVPIKVDREERPDVDRIYMSVRAGHHGRRRMADVRVAHAGLEAVLRRNVFPAGEPLGAAGLPRVCSNNSPMAWQTDRDKITAIRATKSSKNSRSTCAGRGVLGPDRGRPRIRLSSIPAHASIPGSADSAARRRFPRGVAYNFLFRYCTPYEERGSRRTWCFSRLRDMAKGGMNDQLGGGFHRYSVDAQWFVPHFEKMLYDQAQLAVSYLEGYQISGDAGLAEVAREIFDYVLRDMTDAGGGFYSAEDADSVIDPAHPNEKGEGAFYIWTRAEIDEVLGSPAAEWFSYVYGVEAGRQRHRRSARRNSPAKTSCTRDAPSRTPHAIFKSVTEMQRSSGRTAGPNCSSARGTRVRPHLDDKILTAWNGLMISAFAKGWIRSERAKIPRRCKAIGRFHPPRHVQRRSPAAALASGRSRDSRLPGRLCVLRARIARSLRGVVRRAIPQRRERTNGKNAASSSRIRQAGRILQHGCRRRKSGDAHQGGLRRRGAIGQFDCGPEPASACACVWKRGLPAIGREIPSSVCCGKWPTSRLTMPQMLVALMHHTAASSADRPCRRKYRELCASPPTEISAEPHGVKGRRCARGPKHAARGRARLPHISARTSPAKCLPQTLRNSSRLADGIFPPSC